MLCDKVLSAEERVTFVMHIDRTGEILEWKAGVSDLRMPEDVIQTLGGLWSATIIGVLDKLEKFFGKTDYFAIQQERMNIFCIPWDGEYIVMASRESIPAESIQKIKEHYYSVIASQQ